MIGGLGLARGYVRRPELTAEKFFADPFGTAPGGRLYRTGDLVRRRRDGALVFLGRIDRAGEDPGVPHRTGRDRSAFGRAPGVREAVVVAREDEPGEKRLVGYYTAADEQVSVESLRRHLASALPEYMVPAHM